MAVSFEEMQAKFESLSEESVGNALDELRSAQSESIVPFTGYYSMTGPGLAPGAFLSIDTTEYYYQLTQKIVVSVAQVTVSVSTDGTSSKTYPLNATTSFDGQTLTIPNVLTITLTRGYDHGVLVTFQGTVNNFNHVFGSTRFNPITLKTFIGSYYAANGSGGVSEVLSISDTTIAFDDGSGLKPVRFYSFTPLMFVLTFANPAVPQSPYRLMMGTAAGLGLACFIQGANVGEYAVTIPGGST